MTRTEAKGETADQARALRVDEEVAYLAKRHRVSPAIVREIIRQLGSSERGPVEREIRKGKTVTTANQLC